MELPRAARTDARPGFCVDRLRDGASVPGWSRHDIQTTMQLPWTVRQLVDLHISDLLNNQLPSHFDYTSQYDRLVFRRLASGHSETDLAHPGDQFLLHGKRPARRGGPPVLRRIDTSPVGFAVFDRVLLTVHPSRLRRAATSTPPGCWHGTRPAPTAPQRPAAGARCPPARPT